MRSAATILVAIASLALAATVSAQDLQVGDTLAVTSFDDQHGERRAIDANTRLILFAGDMDGGDHAKAALADFDAAALDSVGAVYVVDISGMPRLISRMFALPNMRKRSYPMLLDRDGESTASFPRREGEVTMIFVDGLKIERVGFATSAAEVAAALSATGSTE